MDALTLLALAIIAVSLYIMATRGDVKEAARSFVTTVLFALSWSLFYKLFVDPLSEQIQSSPLIAFAVWLLATVLLTYVLGKEVPWA